MQASLLATQQSISSAEDTDCFASQFYPALHRRVYYSFCWHYKLWRTYSNSKKFDTALSKPENLIKIKINESQNLLYYYPPINIKPFQLQVSEADKFVDGVLTSFLYRYLQISTVFRPQRKSLLMNTFALVLI